MIICGFPGASKVFIEYLMNSDYNLEEIEEMWVTEDTMCRHYSTSNPIPLLFQTGYLTITDYDDGTYRLGIPNGEVRSALVDQLVPEFLGIQSDRALNISKDMSKMANNGDVDGLMRMFQSILSKASHQHFKINDVENVYNLSFWLICKMAGINAKSEVSVAGGDIDMLIETRPFPVTAVSESTRHLGHSTSLVPPSMILPPSMPSTSTRHR